MTQTQSLIQRDRAYEQIRRLLILQKIPPGRRLAEPEWAERLRISRPALREAFARLKAEGFLQEGPKTGYFVPCFSPNDILESVKVRLMLEGGAIAEICEQKNVDDARFKPLADACDQFERLLDDHYYQALDEADRRFHEALIDAAQCARLSMIYQRAPLPISVTDPSTEPEWSVSLRQTLEEHRAILAAVRKGDAFEAQRILRVHLLDRTVAALGSEAWMVG